MEMITSIWLILGIATTAIIGYSFGYLVGSAIEIHRKLKEFQKDKRCLELDAKYYKIATEYNEILRQQLRQRLIDSKKSRLVLDIKD